MTLSQHKLSQYDQKYMRMALMLARRHRGMTAENPSVGCVIINGHKVVGVSSTSIDGRPHAEVNALAMAGGKAKGATVYVTLEPCAHHGQTPPCAEALIAAGVQQVFVAMKDPFPQVSGRGIAMLKKAGIHVVENCMVEEAFEINRGFFKRVEKGLPWVSMKFATSLDGKIALSNGQSQWITGEASRRFGHVLRARHDAIITGIATVEADNPRLTCRVNGLENRSPIRVVIDAGLRIAEDSYLVKTAHDHPLIVVTSSEHIKKQKKLENLGVKFLHLAEDENGHFDLEEVLRKLAHQGINSVMVEAGEGLSTSFLKQHLVDEVFWFRAPVLLGGDAQGVVKPFYYHTLSEAMPWKMVGKRALGKDIMQIFRL